MTITRNTRPDPDPSREDVVVDLEELLDRLEWLHGRVESERVAQSDLPLVSEVIGTLFTATALVEHL